MNKELTPMKEFIDMLNFKNKNEMNSYFRKFYAETIKLATEFLPKEKQVIQEFTFEVIKRCILLDGGKITEDEIKLVKNDIEDYYNNKFKND